MTETFQNAPLVEIVAELRWSIPQLAGVGPAGNPFQLPAPVVLADNEMTAFFEQVTAAVSTRGFDRSEKRAGLGTPIPVMLQQIVYRYRRADEVPVLAQIGPGIFTVNALPPYKTWAEFRPLLESGVEALLEAFADNKHELAIRLRYIDAFKPALTEAREARAFATDVLGFRLDLPETLQKRMAEGTQAKVAFQTMVPVDDLVITVTVSDGVLAGDSAVLVNTDVLFQGKVSTDKNEILSALDRAHDLIHETFIDMTRSIREKMQPIVAAETANADASPI